ncbi:MAG: phosphate acyltransferase [Pseudomonadota bacterium]
MSKPVSPVVSRGIERLRGSGKKLALPEGEDSRIQQAAQRLLELDVAQPVLLCEESAIKAQASFDLGGVQIVDPNRDAGPELTNALLGKKRKITEDTVGDYIKTPVYHAVAMLNNAEVDAMVAGAVLSTSSVIAAAFAVGPKPGITTLSSFFLMDLQNQVENISQTLLFADCAININPDEEQLAEIAITTADSAAKLLDDEPRLAMLSFSSHGSARHPHVTKVARVVEIVRERAPHIRIDGELQVDTALSPRVAAGKLKDPGEVAGRANVLIFPDLDAGNIAYKLVQYCGGASATGPLLQGFAKPVCDLSRGASVEDIVSASIVTMAMSLDE